jgi:hypothetical protein
MKIFGKEFNKDELLKYIGSVSQIGGIESAELTEGTSKGVREVTVKTAEGLEYAINPDCGMNISSCSFKGIPICWRTGTGSTNPGLYDPQLTGWLRSFNGGLLVTCGLSQIGAACIDDGVAYGLHGRISNTPAEVLSTRSEWVGDRYLMTFEGIVRESIALGQRLVLRRRISSYLDSSEITIEDTITNESWYDTPLLTSYHINFGYPLVSETASVEFKGQRKTEFYNDESKKRGMQDINGCDKPKKDFQEQIYLQDLEARGGFREFEVKNSVEEKDLSVRISFSGNLNNLIHWRQFGLGDYVLGFEPANTTIGGRAVERKNGNVLILHPQEGVSYTIKFNFSRG